MKPWGSQPLFSDFFQSVTLRWQSYSTMTSTWAEDRATRCARPERRPRGQTGWAGTMPASSHPGWHRGAKRTSIAGADLVAFAELLRFTSFAIGRPLGCTRLCERRRCCRAPLVCLHAGAAAAGSNGAGPVIQIRASPIRYGQPLTQPPGAYAARLAMPSDSQSCELTRRFPQRTTSAISGIRGQ